MTHIAITLNKTGTIKSRNLKAETSHKQPKPSLEGVRDYEHLFNEFVAIVNPF